MHSVNLSQAVNMRWPTPDTMNGRDGSNVRKDSNVEAGGAHGVSLHHAVHYESRELAWPTPCAEGRGGSQNPGSHLSLEKAVAGWNKDGTREAVTERRCGPWPTPNASEADGGAQHGDKRKAGGHQIRLRDAVSEEQALPWATPQCQDARHSSANAEDRAASGRQMQLAHQVGEDRCGPRATPAAQDGKNSSLPPSQEVRDTLPGNVIASGAVGVLNPNWEECLMCWPIGWTGTEPMPVLNWPWRSFRGIVAFRGQAQHAWEPPRTVPKLKDRNKRVKAVGNGQDPSALVLAVQVLTSMNVPQFKRAA